MDNELIEIFHLNNELLRLAEGLQDEFNNRHIKREALTADLHILCFFLAKVSKTASAIVGLCQKNFAEDALVLVRTVFEMLVRMLYIFKNDSVERARAFIIYDHIEKRKQLRKIAEWNRKNNIENKAIEDELKKREKICSTLEKRYEICTDTLLWPRKSVEKLAAEVNLTHKYNTVYWKCSVYGHTAISSSRSFVSESKQGISFDLKPDEEVSKEVLIYLFDLFKPLLVEFDSRFNLGYHSKISKLNERFEIFVKKEIEDNNT